MYIRPEYKDRIIAYLKYEKIFPEDAKLEIIDIISEKSAGEGTVNQVFRVIDCSNGKSLIIKQILPYVNSVKNMRDEDLPVDITRLETEVKVETYFNDLSDGICPEIYKLHYQYGFLIQEDLAPLVIMRHELTNGKIFPEVGKRIGTFLAGLFFFTSKYYLGNSDREESASFFNSQASKESLKELIYGKYCALFDENAPFEPEAIELRNKLSANKKIQQIIYKLREKFYNNLDCLCHNDLHLGNIMVDSMTTRIIDAEFGGYAAAFSDLAKLTGSFIVNYVSLTGRTDMDISERRHIQNYDLQMICDLYTSYDFALKKLWKKHEAAYPALYSTNVNLILRQILHDGIQAAIINALFRISNENTMSYDIKKVKENNALGIVQKKMLEVLQQFLMYGDSFKNINDACDSLKFLAGVDFN